MKAVNISTLRADLSSILDAVRHGSTVEILDRTLPIARLVPVEPGTSGSKGAVPPWLAKLARAGVVRLGTGKPVADIIKKRPPGPQKTRALDALLEERRSGR
jgi:prevent-host-death family protein